MSDKLAVPVPERRNSADSLENFARRIEERLRLGKDGPFAMERLVCRLLTGKDVKVAAVMAAKWVEWRYGKPKPEGLQAIGGYALFAQEAESSESQQETLN